MKKKFNQKIVYSLIFSFVLLSSTLYFTNSTLLLGASLSPANQQVEPASDKSTPALNQEQQESSSTAKEVSSEVPQNVEKVSAESLPKNTYIVKVNQTLWEISQEIGVSLTTLMNNNQLSNSFIVEGQVLSY